jgi:hypothetical protein
VDGHEKDAAGRSGLTARKKKKKFVVRVNLSALATSWK